MRLLASVVVVWAGVAVGLLRSCGAAAVSDCGMHFVIALLTTNRFHFQLSSQSLERRDSFLDSSCQQRPVILSNHN